MNVLQEHGPRTEAEEIAACGHTALDNPATRAERAELYTVGAMMLRPDPNAHEGIRTLTASDFLHHGPRLAFQSVARIVAERRTPDAPAVFEDLLRSGQREEFGATGPAPFLADAITFCVAGSDFAYMAAVVKDLAQKRAMLYALREAAHDLKRDPSLSHDENANALDWTREPAADIANRYARRFAAVADSGAGETTVPMVASAHQTRDWIDQRQRDRAQPRPVLGGSVRTGLASVDGIIPAFEPGELAIIAARPGVGKSALAALFARNVAMDGGHVLFFSLEMPHVQQTVRMVAMTSGVGMAALKGHREIRHDEYDPVLSATQTIARLPIAYQDRRGVTSEQIASEVRSYARKVGRLSLVVVDYLQLLKPENPRDNRNYQIGLATKTLRNVAGEVGCPILCLAQLNRSVEGRSDEPRLSDLRDSGEIEQDADIVAFLHVEPATANESTQRVKFIVAKQRNGATATTVLNYVRGHTLFTDDMVPM